MRIWIIGAVFALSAGALAHASPVAAPPPAPDGAIAVAADQNGQAVEAQIGASIAVELQSNASTGVNWVVTAKPDFLADAQVMSGPTVTSERPVLGAPRWQVFVFTVESAGSGEVTLEKRDRTGGVLETFSVTITAQ